MTIHDYAQELKAYLVREGIIPTEVRMTKLETGEAWYVGAYVDGKVVEPFFKVGADRAEADFAVVQLKQALGLYGQ